MPNAVPRARMRLGEFARWLEVAPSYLSKLRAQGVIVCEQQGRSVWVDVVASLPRMGREVPPDLAPPEQDLSETEVEPWIELTGGRREAIAVPAASAVAVARALRPGSRITGTNKGQFSLLDLMRACLDVTGPADVWISTWSSGIRDIETAGWMLETGAIRSMQWVVDRSFATRQPDYAAALMRRFGEDSVCTAETHAKVLLIENEEWKIAIRSSMNLNRNQRFEQFDLDADPAVHAHYLALLSEIRRIAGPGYGDKAAAMRLLQESMGGDMAAPDVYQHAETDAKRDAKMEARGAAKPEASEDEVSYHSERALHERRKRELTEIKLAAARAELLPADTVRDVYGSVGAMVREKVMAIEISAVTHLDEHGLAWLREELRSVLTQIVRDAERMSEPLYERQIEDDGDA